MKRRSYELNVIRIDNRRPLQELASDTTKLFPLNLQFQKIWSKSERLVTILMWLDVLTSGGIQTMKIPKSRITAPGYYKRFDFHFELVASGIIVSTSLLLINNIPHSFFSRRIQQREYWVGNSEGMSAGWVAYLAHSSSVRRLLQGCFRSSDRLCFFSSFFLLHLSLLKAG